MAIRHYFLGANGPDGFHSLYREFCPPDSGNFLWVIKGGPGCGKSTFMRMIGKAAEDAGLDVEYALCSSDPASLDGVLIPGWHVAYLDGTAPHTMDVDFPAASGAYLDLGSFYDIRALRPELAHLRALKSTHQRSTVRRTARCMRQRPFTTRSRPSTIRTSTLMASRRWQSGTSTR